MNKQCKGCSFTGRCRKIYEQIGCFKGPSIVGSVILAFLLPLVVFIGGLVFFERIFTGLVATKELAVAVSFFAALAVTVLVIVLVKLLTSRKRR